MAGEAVGNCVFTVCGPKCSLCCLVLSIWGVIMLVRVVIYWRERGERVGGGGVTVHWGRWGFSPGVIAEKCVVCVLTATEAVSVVEQLWVVW